MMSSSDSDNDDTFNDDMDALRRACIMTTTTINNTANNTTAQEAEEEEDPSYDGNLSDADDLEFFRNIRHKLAAEDTSQILGSRLSDDDDDNDDDVLETFRAIQRRFAAYNNNTTTNSSWNNNDHQIQLPEQVRQSSIILDKESSNNFIVNTTNAFPDNQPSTETIHTPDRNECNARPLLSLPSNSSTFPKSAQLFIDAIRKNRACQKLLRTKLTLIESRIEGNLKLKERVKVLKDFQLFCKRRSGRDLSQKKDPRMQLVLPQTSRDSKKASALRYGPEENSHVENYRMVLKTCPQSFCYSKWTTEESGALLKYLKQEYQKMLLDKLLSGSDDIEGIYATIKDHEITDENIRSYIPSVDWDNFASLHIKGRSGAECEARWLNYEDPLINHKPWSVDEDKMLLMIVKERGLNNWIDTAVSLGTNRTPFQCLARYQRSLNQSMMKSEWTKDDDAQLCTAVEAFGEYNWQIIASTLEGRTGTQCSNRWKKSLDPARQRVGRWSQDEDRRLTVAAVLFGAKTWPKIARFVPGRTQVQCRERWVNCLDPSLNWEQWTEDEDQRLMEAAKEHNYSWSKVAACVSPRTDSQCLRRWKLLCPDDVPKLQSARKIQKAALMSNFVDRENERPNLGPKDFIPINLIQSIPECEKANASKRLKRSSRKVPSKARGRRPRKKDQICVNDVTETALSDKFETSVRSTQELSRLDSSLLIITNSEEVEAMDVQDSTATRFPQPTINGNYAEKPNVVNGFSTKKKRVSSRCSEARTSNGCIMNLTEEEKLSDFFDRVKKRSSNQRAASKRCINIAENQDALSMKKISHGNDVTDMASDKFETLGRNTQELSCLDSSLLMITNSEEVDAADVHYSTSTRFPEPSINGDNAENQNVVNCFSTKKKKRVSSRCSEVKTSNGGIINLTEEEKLSDFYNRAKKRSSKQGAKRKRCMDIAEKQGCMKETCDGKSIVSKTSNDSPFHQETAVLMISDGNERIVCGPKEHGKSAENMCGGKKRVRSNEEKSCSIPDEDDLPLACIFKKRLKVWHPNSNHNFVI